jgi:amino acid transporter
VTAIEARDPPKSLKWPAKSVATILAIAYLLSVMGFYLNVSWQDPSLPSIISRNADITNPGTSIIMIATVNSNIPHAANILSACLIGTVFSAANTTLYVASRTLFGLARGMDTRGPWCTRLISTFGTTNPKTNVPQRAVLFSVLSVIWIPWVHAGSDFSDQWVSSLKVLVAQL